MSQKKVWLVLSPAGFPPAMICGCTVRVHYPALNYEGTYMLRSCDANFIKIPTAGTATILSEIEK